MITQHIPEGYRVPCELCGLDLDVRRDGVFQWTEGWVEKRPGGGGHGISCPVRVRRWSHGHCVRNAAAGADQQLALFP